MWPFRSAPKTETTAAAPAEERSLADPSLFDLSIFGVTASASGVTVTATTATKCTAVRNAVAALAEPCGHLPLGVYRRSGDGSQEADLGHPVASLMTGSVNPWTTAAQFREQLIRDALLTGNGLAVIVRDGVGQPRELHRLLPAAVSIEVDAVTGEPSYVATTGNTTRRFSFRDVIHIRGPVGVDGVTGISAVSEAREAIALALQLEAHANQLFKNGGRPSGILSFPQRLGAEVASRIKKSWQAATSGSNSGGTAVLEEGGSFTPLAFSSVDAQFAEMRAFAVTEIARAFRIPPIFIQDFGRATWSNSAEMGRMFLSYSLEPWLTRIENEFALKLLGDEERAEVFLEFDTDDITAADTAARATAYAQFRSAGIYTANELRRLENLPPKTGGDVLENPYTSTTTTGGQNNG